MDWASSEWMPWYKPDTAGWLELSLAARGAMAEVARKLDKSGQLHLGRRGLRALATLLRLKWDGELEPAVIELIADGRLTWDLQSGILSDPEFEQRRRPSSTERMRELRSRSKSRHGDAGDVTSRAVTQIRSDQIRSDQKIPLPPSETTDDPPEVTKVRTRKALRQKLDGIPLPDDWALTDKLLAWAKSQGVIEHDARAAGERFRRHWLTSAQPNALKRNWDQAYRSWVDGDIERGKIVAASPVAQREADPPPPTPEQLEMRRKTSELVAEAAATMRARFAGGEP